MRLVCAFIWMVVLVNCCGTTVIGTYPFWDGSQTGGWGAAAQSFTVPSNDVMLSSFTFRLFGNGSSYQFSIVNLQAGQPTGVPIYSASHPWSTGDLTVSNINLTLEPGQQYAALIDFDGYTGVTIAFDWPSTFDPYAEGTGFWSNNLTDWTTFPNADLLFQAEFTQVPEPCGLLPFGLLWALALKNRRKATRTQLRRTNPPCRDDLYNNWIP